MIVVALAGLLAPASAQSALYLPDQDSLVTTSPSRHLQHRRHKQRHGRSEKSTPSTSASVKEAAKPQGPLVIAISIDRQTVKVYDANGLFAEAPVSTGMRGHPTPMGVFSVIQKDKFHRSNIYSNAPMPYMQRVTWSGVAMHAGVLPGYPASHGCIRMPMAFAVRMWGWTRMGARVVITPGELAPSEFAHPLLAFHTAPPVPVASAAPGDATKDAQPGVKTDKNAGSVTPEPAKQESVKREAASLEPTSLESATLDEKTGLDAPDVKSANHATTRREQTQTADASGAMAAVVTSAADTNLNSNRVTAVPDAGKDQGRPSDLDKPAASKPDVASASAAPRRAGQIAAFISRKDGKLYVRQNFAPLFETPVTIAASDRPLGTHIFTARADKDDTRTFHWSVVSLPASHRAERSDDSERAARHRKIASPIEMKPSPLPDSAAEALDRVTIPDDAKTKILDALGSGGSIIVSDQGIAAGETGEGTDFIISLR